MAEPDHYVQPSDSDKNYDVGNSGRMWCPDMQPFLIGQLYLSFF